MKKSTFLRGAACISALFAGQAVQADVTAEDVWAHWQSQLALYGEDAVSIGAEEKSDGVLVIRNIAMNVEEDDFSMTASISDITLEEQSDGTVRVTMPDSYPLSFTGEDNAQVNLSVIQDTMEMIVSGDPDALNYALTADRYGFELVNVVDGDVTFTGDASFIGNDLRGSYATTTGDVQEVVYALDAASIDMLVDVQLPGSEGEYIVASGKISDISTQGDIAIPTGLDFEDAENPFAEGLEVAAAYTLGGADYVFDINADGDAAAGSISFGVAALDAQLNAQKMAYDFDAQDMEFNVTSSELPLPVEASLGQYGVGLEVPLSAGDEPSDLRMSIDLVDLSVSDFIWDLFDSGAVLPRDPATIQLDISGKATPKFDVTDPALEELMSDQEIPFDLESLSLNNLRLAVAGALLTGSGAFTFDNSDTETFDGFPRPEGDTVINVSGLNGLLDNLVAMGLVPEEQIMGGRMMMGMFARTVGDDQLETTLEVNGEGHVLVNGQRMR